MKGAPLNISNTQHKQRTTTNCETNIGQILASYYRRKCGIPELQNYNIHTPKWAHYNTQKENRAANYHPELS
jgi:hypothetical protein